MYASQPEVLSYWNRLIERHDLESGFKFNAEFIGSAWDEATQRHTIRIRDTHTGVEEVLGANVLVSAAGPLAAPRLPKVPGIETFQGDWFHNLQWNPDVELRGKRVAVIGNGSSGIQIVVSMTSEVNADEQPGVAEIPGVTLTHYVRSGGYFVPKREEPLVRSKELTISAAAVLRLGKVGIPLDPRLHPVQSLPPPLRAGLEVVSPHDGRERRPSGARDQAGRVPPRKGAGEVRSGVDAALP